MRRGVVPLLAYALLTAAMDVYAGNRFQSVSPAGVAAVSFTLATVFFLAFEVGGHGLNGLRAAAPHRRDLIAINITTALTWLATLYALSYLEPAIVNVLGLALGPVIVVVAGPLLRRSSKVLPTEAAVSVGICVILGTLVWVSFTGRSGLGAVSATHVLVGLGLTVVCAVGSSLNIIYMKRLTDAQCSPGAVLALRFFLSIVAAWVLLVLGDISQWTRALIPGLVVALIGISLPIYVLQIGIKRTEPITTSLMICLSPLFAFLLQLADGRLRFSYFTLGGIVLVVALVALGAVVRGRHDHVAPTAPQAAATTAKEVPQA